MQGPKSTPDNEGAAAAACAAGADMSRLLHDLNQPLSAITNYAQAGSQLSVSGSASPEQLRSLFDKIVEQSKRAAGISLELRAARDRLSAGTPG